MNLLNRRCFLLETGLSLAITGVATKVLVAGSVTSTSSKGKSKNAASGAEAAQVDFHYSPLSWQTAYCFPDDPHKSLVGHLGELRFSRNAQTWPNAYYPEQVEFSFLGMETNVVAEQKLESPAVPIIHTCVERPAAALHLIAFATNRPSEGRVDNVLMEVIPKTEKPVQAVPVMIVRTRQELKTKSLGSAALVHLGAEDSPLFVVTDTTFAGHERTGLAFHFVLKRGLAQREKPLRYFFRFPQEKQDFERIKTGLESLDQLLAEVREFWRRWQPFSGRVSWQLIGQHQDFLIACARNILQAREVRDGKLTFQVGPTCYRGLWVVDGHFILEAARYLGYDAEAQKGLESTWARQGANGGIFAGGGPEHWKDTGIAMFSLVRQAELSQDWSYVRQMVPNVLRGVQFLKELRDKTKSQNNSCGRYGLLAPGFPDGGVGGIRVEFTNTLWALAGLKAVVEAADKLALSEFAETKAFYQELRASCFNAMRQEMHRHPQGFDFLPMVMKEDPQWSAPEEWDRLRPQGAQWALSHAIYPGLLFDKDNPVVKGHIALMQVVTEEGVPIETGWIPHEGLWTYNAAFVAHVYLWAGLTDWARRTFVGFLNHASPLYCWREEQPLRSSLVSTYIGDMPHNWASAECILYLRHMLALEDGTALRLLAGVGDPELAAEKIWSLAETPTRFGRLNLTLEPHGRRGWLMKFQRGSGPAPKSVVLPGKLGERLNFSKATGVTVKRSAHIIEVDPTATSWEVIWRS